MNQQRVDTIIRYALARAAHGETPWSRELGPIHLLKYVYLADVAFAERNGGQSFTGAEWVFFHYGPWSPDVLDRVDAVARQIAIENIISSTRFENDARRWRVDDPEEADEIEATAARELPAVVTSAVGRAVRTYGSDTTGLLHDVYRTAPMLHAAPRERLDLAHAQLEQVERRRSPAVESPAPVSRKQEKREEVARRAFQDAARQKLAEVRAKRAAAAAAPRRRPRYDEVFIAGQRWLDELGGAAPSVEGEAELEFDDTIWKSPWRTNSGTA
jgi:hypothetical protein